MAKSRSYVFTLNNPTEQEVAHVTAHLAAACYGVFGREAGTSGTPHLQGYVYYTSQRSHRAVCKDLPRAHVEVAKGTPLQASTYCKKDGDFTEAGTLPQAQGARTDLPAVVQLITDGGTMRDVINSGAGYQATRHAELVLKYLEPKRNFEPEVRWYYGCAGSGKTRAAYEWLGDDAYTCMGTSKWFEGYDAHENVLIDDYRKNFCTFADFLRMLDRHAYRVEAKGGSRQLLAKKMVITTPHHPKDTWDGREDINQLLRRITVVQRFKRSGPCEPEPRFELPPDAEEDDVAYDPLD